MVHVIYTVLISETPSVTDRGASLPPSKKKPRKTLYILTGIIAVAAIALAVVFLAYQGMSATIPLIYNYIPGSHMTYNMTITGSNATGQNSSETGTFNVQITSFDGENYTINVTATFPLQEGPPYSLTYTEKMNKTGYIKDISHYTLNGTELTYITTSGGFPFLGTFFEKDQAKMGETWQVPMSSLTNPGNSSSGWMGNLTFTFGDVQYVTVPAGTYKVFRLDITGSNLTLNLNQSLSHSEHMSFTAQEYVEYGTCRPIDSHMQENLSYQASGQNFTMNLSLQMTLVRDVRD